MPARRAAGPVGGRRVAKAAETCRARNRGVGRAPTPRRTGTRAVTTAALVAEFPRLRVLVVGDVCLDRWCRYDPALADPSRETGIPRIGVVSTEVTPGAAGTVANNVAALGAQVSVLGIAGSDGFGHELSGALHARGIRSSLIHTDRVCTFTYTK